jgi:hypothetical protein
MSEKLTDIFQKNKQHNECTVYLLTIFALYNNLILYVCLHKANVKIS